MYIRFLMGIIMARSAESILEDIYDELKKNSKSSGLNDKSYNDLLRELKKNNNSGDSSGSDDKKKKDGGLFNFIKKKAQALGSSFEKIGSDLSDLADSDLSPGKRIKAGLDSINDVIKMIPYIGGFLGKVFSLAETVFLGVYNKLNSWYEQYSSFNTSGMYSTDGMVGLQKVLGTTMMSFDEYSRVISSNKDALVSFGGNSGVVFSGFLNNLLDTESKYGALNMSIDQMGEYILSNIKALKVQGSFNRMTDAQKKQSDREYMDQLNAFSKVLGISTDELNKNINGSQGMIEKISLQGSLMSHGMKSDIASAAVSNTQLALKSMGEVGNMFLDSVSEYAARGVIGDGSALGKDFLLAGDEAMRGVLTTIGSNLNSGKYAKEGSSQEIAKMIYNNRDKLIASVNKSLAIAQMRPDGAAAAAHFSKIIETLSTMADPTKAFTDMKKQQPFDNLVKKMTNITRSMGTFINDKFFSAISRTEGTFGNILDGFSNAKDADGYKKAFANLGEKVPVLIRDFFGTDLGNWILGKDLKGNTVTRSFENLNNAIKDVIDVKAIIESILPQWICDIIEGKTSLIDGVANKLPSIRDIFKRMGFKDWIIDIFLEDTNQAVPDVGTNALQQNINELDKRANNLITTMSDGISNISTTISDKSKSLLSSIGSWFTSATSQSVGNLNPAPVPNGTPWQVQPEQSNVLPLPTSIMPQNAGWTGTIYQQNMVTTQLLENSQKQTEILQQISDSNDRTNNHLTNVRTN